jgi:hypothetical protein
VLGLWEAGVDGVDGDDVADGAVEGGNAGGEESAVCSASGYLGWVSGWTNMQRPIVDGSADL